MNTNKEVNALLLAAKRGKDEIINTLVRAGADVNPGTNNAVRLTSLLAAIMFNHHSCVDALLIKAGADVKFSVKQPHRTPINFAVIIVEIAEKANENDMMWHLRLLLRAGVHVNYWQREISVSAVHLSVTSRSRNILLCLFAAGDRVSDTDPNLPDYLTELMSRTDRTLMSRCRDKIHSHLMQLSPVNLFVRVPKFELPILLVDYLLYNVSMCH